MTVTVTFTFNSIEEAIEALAPPRAAPRQVPIEIPRHTGSAESPAAEPEQPRKRKPRSDAGQPRGPYKTTTTGEPAASEPGATATSVATTPAAPATPTNPAAPTGSEASPAASTPPSAGTSAAAGTALTEADARAALKVVSDTPGLGMQTCLGALHSFGVDRITKLPKEEYANFIAKCRKIVDDHKAAAK